MLYLAGNVTGFLANARAHSFLWRGFLFLPHLYSVDLSQSEGNYLDLLVFSHPSLTSSRHSHQHHKKVLPGNVVGFFNREIIGND